MPRPQDGKEIARDCVRHDIHSVIPVIRLIYCNVKGAQLNAGRYKFENKYKRNGDCKKPARRRRCANFRAVARSIDHGCAGRLLVCLLGL